MNGSSQAATPCVDISGFIPLTETLMQYREDGGEVLSEALEAIFVPLVSQVHACGGLIPLFAGDAHSGTSSQASLDHHRVTCMQSSPLSFGTR